MNRNYKLLLKLTLIVALLAGACNLPFQATKTPRIKYITATPLPTDTEAPVAPSDTPLAPATAENTLPPPPEATSTPTVLFTVAVTFSPTPTDSPTVRVRLRNMTGKTANFYRHGRSGEIHFLGWLEHGYYGIYEFPSLGEWVIRYCARDKQGDSFNCQDKTIAVKKEDQEFRFP